MRTNTQLKKFFVRLLISLTALILLAQLTGAGQSANQSVAPVKSNAIAWVQAKRLPEAGANNARRFAVNDSQIRQHGARATEPGGSVSFLPPVIYSSGGLLGTSVAVSDLDGDRKLDLVVANCAVAGFQNCSGEGSIGVLLGQGDGTFQAATTYDSGGGNAQSVAVADVNGDGKPDIVVANEGSSTVGVLLGNGDGTFQSAIIYGSGGNYPVSIAVADVNGDGKPDLVVANLCDINCSGVNGGVVGVLLGNGDGTFQTAVPYSTGQGSLSSVAVADVNGDGKPDLVVANEGVGVLLGKGDGTFQLVVTYTSGGDAPTSVAVADVNGDGKPDLLVANCSAGGNGGCIDESVDGSVGVLLGHGDGTFQTVVAYDSGGSGALSVAVADVNGDGTPDLLVANFCDSGCFFGGTVGVLLGQGHGIFASPVDLLIPGEGNSIAVADLNNDGKPDLLVATDAAPPMGAVAVLLNNAPFNKFTTSIGFISSLNPSIYGQRVTWTATVTSSGSITPTGRVNFTSNIVTIGSATLNSNGVATLTRSNLNATSYPVTTVYKGDTNNLGSTSVFVNQVVKQTTTKATLASLPNPSAQGEAVTFTAKISSPTVVPTGPVTFMAGKTVLGTAQLSGGKATLVISSLPVGSTRVTVTYSGNSNIAKSSASITQMVR
jgi:hypothetical protein